MSPIFIHLPLIFFNIIQYTSKQMMKYTETFIEIVCFTESETALFFILGAFNRYFFALLLIYTLIFHEYGQHGLETIVMLISFVFRHITDI